MIPSMSTVQDIYDLAVERHGEDNSVAKVLRRQN